MDTSAPRHQSCPKCHHELEGLRNFCAHCGEDLRGLTPLSDTLSGAAVGRLIDDRYRLKEKLGEGGMGAVYKVEHVRMGKVCALKLLRPEIATDKKLKSRFHQEARLVSKLSSPNTIQVFDFGELDDGSLYLAMEYLSGRDLAWMLRATGPLPEDKVLAIGIQVLSSLAEAHEHGIIHRDIKPANVMVVKRRERDDLVKVLDFGIAKLRDAEGKQHITGAAEFIGTPTYMSPEQAKGEQLDARSDLYSVGAMLFELATGRAPFEAPTPMGIVTKHLSEPPPRFQDVAPERVLSPGLEQIVRKALAKERADRFANADQMRLSLEKLHRALAALPNDFTPLPDENTAEMARREDFDRFERSLKLRRTLVPILAFTLLAFGGGAAFRFLKSAELPSFGPTRFEQEPNDVPQQATKLALEVGVEGFMGAAAAANESDVDIYRLDLTEPQTLRLSLSGVSDLNLVLEAFWLPPRAGKSDRTERVLLVDDAPLGAGELVDGFLVQPGTLFLRVQERAHTLELDQHRSPREKARVPYTLEARRTELTGTTVEREPNDAVKAAQRVSDPSVPLTGFLGAYVPLTAATRGQTWSTHDFYSVDQGFGDEVAALVLPPEGVRLEALDGTQELKASAPERIDSSGTPRCAPPCFEAPALVPLSLSAEGSYLLRVQASEWRPSPGSRYQVAFISSGARGLEAALKLASSVAARGNPRAAAELLDMAAQRFPSSPQAKEALDTALQFKPVAEDTP